MGDKVFNVVGAIVTVSLVTAVLARGTQAAQVITAVGNAFTSSLKAAQGR